MDHGDERAGIPAGYWWKVPLILGPVVWFGVPVALLLLQVMVVALLAPFDLSPDSVIYRGLVLALIAPLGILGNMLQLGSLLCVPALLPAMAMAAWLIRRGQLSLWAWGPGMSAYAIVLVGGGLTLIDVSQGDGAPPVTPLLWTFAVIGAGACSTASPSALPSAGSSAVNKGRSSDLAPSDRRSDRRLTRVSGMATPIACG
jgi:hypothetical protein